MSRCMFSANGKWSRLRNDHVLLHVSTDGDSTVPWAMTHMWWYLAKLGIRTRTTQRCGRLLCQWVDGLAIDMCSHTLCAKVSRLKTRPSSSPSSTPPLPLSREGPQEVPLEGAAGKLTEGPTGTLGYPLRRATVGGAACSSRACFPEHPHRSVRRRRLPKGVQGQVGTSRRPNGCGTSSYSGLHAVDSCHRW